MDSAENPEPKDGTEKIFDPVAFDEAMRRWRRVHREQMLAEGFATTEELMNDIRGR